MFRACYLLNIFVSYHCVHEMRDKHSLACSRFP